MGQEQARPATVITVPAPAKVEKQPPLEELLLTQFLNNMAKYLKKLNEDRQYMVDFYRTVWRHQRSTTMKCLEEAKTKLERRRGLSANLQLVMRYSMVIRAAMLFCCLFAPATFLSALLAISVTFDLVIPWLLEQKAREGDAMDIFRSLLENDQQQTTKFESLVDDLKRHFDKLIGETKDFQEKCDRDFWRKVIGKPGLSDFITEVKTINTNDKAGIRSFLEAFSRFVQRYYANEKRSTSEQTLRSVRTAISEFLENLEFWYRSPRFQEVSGWALEAAVGEENVALGKLKDIEEAFRGEIGDTVFLSRD